MDRSGYAAVVVKAHGGEFDRLSGISGALL